MNIPLSAYWDLLSRHIQPQRKHFFWLVFLMLSGIGLQIVNPQILRSFIDSALSDGTTRKLLLDAAAFIGIAVIQQVVSVSVTYLGESVAWTATNALRNELAWHCLNLDMSFHNQHTPGELIERIDGDVTQMANFFSQFTITLIGNGLLMAGILVVLFFESWQVGLAFTVFALVTLTILGLMRGMAVKHHKARREAEAELSGFFEEQLAGTEDIRSSGAVDFSLHELFRIQANILHHDRKAHQKGWVVADLVPGAMLILGNILAIVSGYLLYNTGAITTGTVYLFIYYINLLETPIWALTRQVENFQTIGACVERLSELRKIKSSVEDGSKTELVNGPLSLSFNQVSFAYQDAPDDSVLSNLTFHLEPGRILGLLGRTGSGKTTLTRLVFRLFDPTHGKIALENTDLTQLKLSYLRKRVAVVTQDVQLFRATLRDNLTFFDRTIPDELILEAIKQLELEDWFHSLSEGLDTELSAGSRSLSGGEAQLLALTRVFLRQPSLVILDEASSRLDPFTEQRIERALNKLLAGRTAIIVAHRLNTVFRADEIMILDEGRICEHGLRPDLASDPASHFYHLLQTGLEEVLA
jgi:ATP-binding cassette, subfamily B, bacterial